MTKLEHNLGSLKFLTTIIWYLLVATYLYFILTPIIEHLFGEAKKDKYFYWVQFSINTFQNKTLWSQILLFISLANYLWVLIAFKNFRKLIVNFYLEEIFEKETEKLLKKIGKALFRCGVIFYVIELILRYFINDNSESKHVAFLVVVILYLSGYFFNVLAELFKKATKLKKENELTI